MSEIKKLDISKRMSQVVVYNNTIETAGIVADDTNLDIEGQTSQILDKIDSYLLKLGSHKDKILKATIWLNDMKHFDDMIIQVNITRTIKIGKLENFLSQFTSIISIIRDTVFAILKY